MIMYPTMSKGRSFIAAASFLICIIVLPTNVEAFGVSSTGLQYKARTLLTQSAVTKSVPFRYGMSLPMSASDTTGELPKCKVLNSESKSMKKIFNTTVRSLIFAIAIASTVSARAPSPAFAAAKKVADSSTAVEHLHVGQKIANYFRSFGLPDLAVLALISALPVVELRGAVPVGVWMGLPISKVLPVCVLGNMAPIVPLLFLLRNDKLKELMSPILSRAEKKSASLGVGSIEKQWASLAAFVGIPLPGTGAWTGAMGAFLLGMPTAVALSSIFTGVVSAGMIMTAITLAGKKGGITALAILALITGREFFAKKEEEGA
mmetsp:Transcript_11996/g.24744  ORF Transcript_11996/g.24744 Transcript_11996/m.24744 type:complete len:319 (-) Transcript_11996:166-1122(-)